MRLILALAFAVCSFQALALETVTTVVSVVDSLKTKRLLVLSGVDGAVYKTDTSREMKAYLESMINIPVTITYQNAGSERIITNISPLSNAQVQGLDLNYFAINLDRDDTPTDVGSLERAQRLFKSLNDGDKSRSQCFKRAHIWSWDLWTKHGITSQKIYMFYTRRYIQLEDFDWWFHVAPMVVANGVEFVMDKTFTKEPTTVPEWKKRFMKSEVQCNEIKKYSEYENHQWNRLCYVMKTPMYYFRPLDMRRRDEQGIHKKNWVLMELQDARRAFADGATIYEALDTGKRTINH
jgi:hypothetical protein